MKLLFNELDLKFTIDITIGFVMAVLGIFFDPIAGKLLLVHNEGFGLGQIIWIGFWVAYIILSAWFQIYYGK